MPTYSLQGTPDALIGRYEDGVWKEGDPTPAVSRYLVYCDHQGDNMWRYGFKLPINDLVPRVKGYFPTEHVGLHDSRKYADDSGEYREHEFFLDWRDLDDNDPNRAFCRVVVRSIAANITDLRFYSLSSTFGPTIIFFPKLVRYVVRGVIGELQHVETLTVRSQDGAEINNRQRDTPKGNESPQASSRGRDKLDYRERVKRAALDKMARRIQEEDRSRGLDKIIKELAPLFGFEVPQHEADFKRFRDYGRNERSRAEWGHTEEDQQFLVDVDASMTQVETFRKEKKEKK